MFHLLDNLSENSKDVVRKLLYNTIKFGFEETDAQFNELCQCLYSEKIDEIRSKNAFENLLDTLLCIGGNLPVYISQQMEVIGVDKDCDIKYIEEKLINYQSIINELKGGIKDGRNHTIRFTPDYAKRNLIVPKYEKLLSLANEIEEVLQALYEAYLELYDVIHSNENELVLNRLNKQFENVKNHIIEDKGFISDFWTHLNDIVSQKEKRAKATTNRSGLGYMDTNTAQRLIHDIVNKTVGEEYYSVYDNPLELARTIRKKELDNEQVNALFAMMAMLSIQRGVNNPSSRARGRPPGNFCYTDCIEPVTEILSSRPVQLKRKQKKITLYWVVALFVSCAEYVHEDLYGYISAFYRFLGEVGLKIQYGLRYLQMKIKEFKQYLHDKQKGGFYDTFDNEPTSLWKRRLKRFAPLEEIKKIITEKFIQFKIV